MKTKLAVTILLISVTASLAVDNGQFKDVPENIKSWFKSIKSPNGVPCCDISDGHRTQWDIRQDDYWIPVPLNEQEWIKIPKEAIVYNAGNPTGDAVVWWTPLSTNPGGVYIRCFVSGSGI